MVARDMEQGSTPEEAYTKFWFGNGLWFWNRTLGLRNTQENPGYGVFGRIFLLPFYFSEKRVIGRHSAGTMEKTCEEVRLLLRGLDGIQTCSRETIPSFCVRQALSSEDQNAEMKAGQSSTYKSPGKFLQCFYRKDKREEAGESRWELYEATVSYYACVMQACFPGEAGKQQLRQLLETYRRTHGKDKRSNLYRSRVEKQNGEGEAYDAAALLLFDILLWGAFSYQCADGSEGYTITERQWRNSRNRAFDAPARQEASTPLSVVVMPGDVFSLVLQCMSGEKLRLEEYRRLTEYLKKETLDHRAVKWKLLLHKLSADVKDCTKAAFGAAAENEQLWDLTMEWVALSKAVEELIQ